MRTMACLMKYTTAREAAAHAYMLGKGVLMAKMDKSAFRNTPAHPDNCLLLSTQLV